MELQLRGRTALVTGASMGIGRAIAASLAQEGVRLAVMARRRTLLEELERELGQKLVIIECDLLKENSVQTSRRFTLESNDAQWEEALTLNFVRQRQLAHALLPQMIERKWGRIINEEDIPVGEYGQPQDLANLVCFLASPLARYITGAVIPVDGGLRRYQF
jgi:3-oxoacyl-[acyl-carrier protein] reductase